ncbi:hypothetical protein D9757_010511 [Collybiopsis confluens]|uniref:Protein kinase domain-containing protein n=1 Tax=Collybiopsis confluens TaxID=2823264 RepID=A0A8H5LSZ3_9AGAR|nr:hypothetical protein D9757_010511 [Collybiopsis confluens]
MGPDLTLESLGEDIRKLLSLHGGDLLFFKLDDPIEVTSLDDIKDKCDPLLNQASLGDASDICVSLQTLKGLGIQKLDANRTKLVPLVVLWTAPSEHTSVSSRSLTAIAEHPDAREAIARQAQNRPPPSTGAKSTELLSAQNVQHLDAAYNHRPPELSPPPLAIYDPVFAKFRREAATLTESLDFTVEELDRASNFIDVSLRHYPNEHARQNALKSLLILDRGYWDSKKISVNDSIIEPDGGSWVYSEIDSKPGPVACSSAAELKNGGGDGGCDPSDQVQRSYIKIVSSRQYQPIRLVSCCPALLIGLSGHTFAVWGGVFADRFFFERLALMHVGPQAPATSPSPIGGRSDMEVGIREVAKLLRNLNSCIGDLNVHYTSLTSPPLLPDVGATPIPSSSTRLMRGIGITPALPAPIPFDSLDPSRFVHWKSFVVQGQEYHLEYRHRLTDCMEKTVFRATITTGTNSKKVDVVVKFAYRYGARGHRLLAEAGLAPRLYHCAFEETIGMWAVVMDYVEGRVSNGKLIEGEGDSLKHAIEILHAQDLVFGDLRGPNVIITESKKRICLVDFEWCGRCVDNQDGSNVIPRVRYPTNISMNHEIGWAEGVGRDLILTPVLSLFSDSESMFNFDAHDDLPTALSQMDMST